MKTKSPATRALLFALPPLALALALALAQPAFAAASRAGDIAKVVGFKKVHVDSPQAAREVEAIAPVFNGDQIKTTVDQAVHLRFDDGSELVVGPSSGITIEQATPAAPKTTVLSLVYGVLYTMVRKAYSAGESFTVKTPTGVMGVRGTQWVTEVSRQGGETRVYGFDGRVLVASEPAGLARPDSAVAVTGGKMTSIGKGQPPAAASPYDVAQYRAQLQSRFPAFGALMNQVQSGAGTSPRPPRDSRDAAVSSDPLKFPNGLEKKKRK